MAGETGGRWRLLGLALTFGFTLLAAMALGYYGGRYLDSRLGTSPYLSLVGLLLGVGAAFRILVRDLLQELGGRGRPGGRGRSPRGRGGTRGGTGPAA
ncbi:MAG: AtpZ/AtpI family protein [Acetobacteraceae bacterium]|nr:AtpZ/AtpI family protein [Acetobacteraceae bacterium]